MALVTFLRNGWILRMGSPSAKTVTRSLIVGMEQSTIASGRQMSFYQMRRSYAKVDQRVVCRKLPLAALDAAMGRVTYARGVSVMGERHYSTRSPSIFTAYRDYYTCLDPKRTRFYA